MIHFGLVGGGNFLCWLGIGWLVRSAAGRDERGGNHQADGAHIPFSSCSPSLALHPGFANWRRPSTCQAIGWPDFRRRTETLADHMIVTVAAEHVEGKLRVELAGLPGVAEVSIHVVLERLLR